jgi:hypothetical protein
MHHTLGYAKTWLKQKLLNGGCICPLCMKLAKIYKRQINAGMARSLIRMYHEFGLDFGYLPKLPAKSREEGKLVYWQLVEELQTPRPDGGRAGWWRVTEKGEAFILQGLQVPKYVYLYDGQFLCYDDPNELIDIDDALGDEFDLGDLMSR